MLNIILVKIAWDDLGWLIKNDIKLTKKVHQIIEATAKNPFEGVGMPEALKFKYKGYWSRRINLEHRIIYKVENDNLIIISILGHYQ